MRKLFSLTKAQIQDELSIPIASLGAIDTAHLIAYAIGGFASGRLVDRLGDCMACMMSMKGKASPKTLRALRS